MHTLTKISYWSKVVILGLVVGLGLQIVSAWNAPGVAAPGGNIDGPITAGGDQSKSGVLQLGGLGVTGASLFSNTLTVATGQNICLGGTCRTTWPSGSTAWASITGIPGGFSDSVDDTYARGELLAGVKVLQGRRAAL